MIFGVSPRYPDLGDGVGQRGDPATTRLPTRVAANWRSPVTFPSPYTCQRSDCSGECQFAATGEVLPISHEELMARLRR